MLADILLRKSTGTKKTQKKAWNRLLGTEILRYQEFHGITTQISEENELYLAK